MDHQPHTPPFYKVVENRGGATLHQAVLGAYACSAGEGRNEVQHNREEEEAALSRLLCATAMRSVYRTRRSTNPLNNLRPIEHKVPAKVEDWHWVWTTAANLLAHPRYVGVQTTGDFFNRYELVRIQWSNRGNNYRKLLNHDILFRGPLSPAGSPSRGLLLVQFLTDPLLPPFK